MNVKNKFETICIATFLPIIFALSIRANMTSDGRIFQRVLGLIAAYCIYYMFSTKRNYIKRDIIFVMCSNIIITVLAYFIPVVNTKGGQIVPNAFFVLISMMLIAIFVRGFDNNAFKIGLMLTTVIIIYTGIGSILNYIKGFGTLGKSYLSIRLVLYYLNPIPGGTVFLVGFCLASLFCNKKVSAIIRSICVICIFFCRSRSVTLGLVVAIILIVFQNRKQYISFYSKMNNTTRILISSIGVMCGLALVAYIYVVFASRVASNGYNEPYIVRSTHWKYALYSYFNQDAFWMIFGHGYCSANGMITEVFDDGYAIIDNGLLTLLYENGAIAFIAIVKIIIGALKTVLRGIDNCDKTIWTCALVVISLVIPSCFYEIQTWNSPIILAIFCMAPFMLKHNNYEGIYNESF